MLNRLVAVLSALSHEQVHLPSEVHQSRVVAMIMHGFKIRALFLVCARLHRAPLCVQRCVACSNASHSRSTLRARVAVSCSCCPDQVRQVCPPVTKQWATYASALSRRRDRVARPKAVAGMYEVDFSLTSASPATHFSRPNAVC